MTSTKPASFLCLIITLFGECCLAATSIDLRTEYESWNSGINGNNTAILYGAGGTYNINRNWTIGGGLMMGSPDSDNNLDNLKRRDFDIAIGYRLRPKVATYAGYRLVSIEYDNAIDNSRSFTDLTHGLGVGINLFHPVFAKTIAYGRLGLSGLLSTLDVNSVPKDHGFGVSVGFEIGMIYEILQRTTIGLALKQQSATIDYQDESDNWNHNYYRIGTSLSHYF